MMRILDKAIYKQIEWYLYNYRYIKRELAQDKADIAASSPNEIGKFGQGRSRHTDPTALKALKLTSDDILKKEQWVRVIEKTIEKFKDTDQGTLLELQYFQQKTRYHVWSTLHIDRSSYYNWKDSVVYYTAFLAQKFNLIDIEKSKTF